MSWVTMLLSCIGVSVVCIVVATAFGLFFEWLCTKIFKVSQK